MDFGKLWQNFTDTVQNHYMDFSGRAGRAQFWYFILICFGISLIAAIIDSVIGVRLLGAIVGLGLLLPTAGAAARRLQDTGQNGQIVWIWVAIAAIFWLVALLGVLAFVYFLATLGWVMSLAYVAMTIIIIYFCAQPGQSVDNAYGPPPPVFNPGRAMV